MDTSPIVDPGRRTRRRHSAEFKARLVALCRNTGTPLATVALANGVNANLLRRWVAQSPLPGATTQTSAPSQVEPKATFMALELPQPAAASQACASTGSVTIELRHGDLSARVTLPAVCDSAAWLRHVLR